MAGHNLEEPVSLEDVEFPHPREDSIASVLAARKSIQDQHGAARHELISGLAPEENYRIGISAVQALELLNDPEGYRDWWWREVVRPGLEALPDVAVPADDDGLWRPVDENTS